MRISVVGLVRFAAAKAFHAAIASPGNQVFVSAATAWEIGLKRASGKLAYEGPVGKAIEAHGFFLYPSPLSTPSGLVRFRNSIATRSTGCWWRRLSLRD